MDMGVCLCMPPHFSRHPNSTLLGLCSQVGFSQDTLGLNVWGSGPSLGTRLECQGFRVLSGSCSLVVTKTLFSVACSYLTNPFTHLASPSSVTCSEVTSSSSDCWKRKRSFRVRVREGASGVLEDCHLLVPGHVTGHCADSFSRVASALPLGPYVVP